MTKSTSQIHDWQRCAGDAFAAPLITVRGLLARDELNGGVHLDGSQFAAGGAAENFYPPSCAKGCCYHRLYGGGGRALLGGIMLGRGGRSGAIGVVREPEIEYCGFGADADRVVENVVRLLAGRLPKRGAGSRGKRVARALGFRAPRNRNPDRLKP